MDESESDAFPLSAASSTLEVGALRWQTAELLADRADAIVTDAVAMFPYTTRLSVDCLPVGAALARLVASTVRTGQCDPRSGALVDLVSLTGQASFPPDQLFTFAYLTMASAIEELASDPQLGTGAARWPQVAETVRRAFFDVLGAWTTRIAETPSASSITDTLTTLHTRPVIDAALVKELQRAERFEHWLSMLIMEIDNLSDINRVRGYGVGDRVLESIGGLIRRYFRQHDWVARYSEDSIAVLLPETGPEDAASLANEMRTMLRERVTFQDYRANQDTTVTVSIGVVSARALDGEPIDGERFLLEVEAAVERARTSGRQRVELVQIPPRLMSIEEAAIALDTDPDGVGGLVASGALEPVNTGRHVRLERAAVLRLAADK